MSAHEEFHDVPGWTGFYQVSESGSVRSLDRIITRSNGAKQTIKGRLLQPYADRKGYLYVNFKRPGERPKHHYIHQIVLRTFVGPAPAGGQACHNDGGNQNNHISNLRYGSASDNMNDRVVHGVHHNAAKKSCPMGHPYSPENTQGRSSKVSRDCLECRRDRIRLRSAFRAHRRQQKALLSAAVSADKLMRLANRPGEAA